MDGEEDGSEEGDELGWNDVFPEDTPPPGRLDDDASEDDSVQEDQAKGKPRFLSLGACG